MFMEWPKSFHEAYGIKSEALRWNRFEHQRKIVKLLMCHPTDGFDEDPIFTQTLLKLAQTTIQSSGRYLFVDSLW